MVCLNTKKQQLICSLIPIIKGDDNETHAFDFSFNRDTLYQCLRGGGGGSTTPAATAPAAPTGLIIAGGNTQISPSWTAVTGATSYNVYYRTTPGVTIANGTKVTGATAGTAITGLTNKTPYYVAITALNATGESALSGEASATPQITPAGIKVTSGDSQATLKWYAVTGATSYNVYYRTSPGVTTANGTKITNTTSGTPITGLTNGTAYFFVVTEIIGGIESAVSSEVGTTPHVPVTGIVTGLTVTGGSGQATLSWTGAMSATSYNVYYSTTAGVTVANGTKVTGISSGISGGVFGSTSSSSAITGLTNGTKYYFIVTAMSNSNTIENPASIEVSATPQAIANLMGGAIQTPLALTGTVSTLNTVDATGAALSLAYNKGITTDGSNLYVNSNGALKAVEIATGVVTVGASTGFDSITTDGNNLYGKTGLQIDKLESISNVSTLFPVYTILAGGGASGSLDGTGAAAQFSNYFDGMKYVSGVTTDGTNLYVTDTGNHTIRKVVIATGAVTTLAGTAGQTGTTDAVGAFARFNLPIGITTDGTNLYVADSGNNLIRKVVIADGTVTTVAGGFLGLTYDGIGTGAKFSNPNGITTDGTNLYVADTGNDLIRKVVIATGEVTTIAGTPGSFWTTGIVDGTGSAAAFGWPKDITTDGTSLYVIDGWNGVIRKIQ